MSFIKDKLKLLPFASSIVNRYRVAKKKRLMRTFYTQFIRPGDLCFDIGANFGRWSEAFLSLGAQVIAVEPQSYCYGVLSKKFNTNSSITIIKKGVGFK